MSNILGMHEQMNFPVYRNRHLRSHNVVSRIHIMLRIKTKEVQRSLIDKVRVNRPKFSIRTGIAEIESELSRLNLDRHGTRRRRREIRIGPGLHSEDSEGQNFDADDQQSRNYQPSRAARKSLEFYIRTPI